MRNQTDIKAILQTVGNMQPDIQVDEAGLMAEYENIHANRSGIAIKVLIVIGGILATLAFTGFLVIAGLYDSETGLMATGFLFIVGSLLLKRFIDKLILDTFAVTFYITGCTLVLMGAIGADMGTIPIGVMFMIIAILAICVVHSYVMVLVSTCIFFAALFTLLIIENPLLVILVYGLLLTEFTWMILKEGWFISLGKVISKLYNPVRMGILISLLGTAYAISRPWLVSPTLIYSNRLMIIAAFALILMSIVVFQILNQRSSYRTTIIIILSTLVPLLLLPVLRAPYISVSLLIILGSFMSNFKTGLVAGILSLIWFVSEYYYDLHYDLMTKSLMMMCSGAVLLLAYIFLHMKLRTK